jgi:hypothetical protein
MSALGYGISAVAKPLTELARTWPLALAGRFIDRAGKGLRDLHVMRCWRERARKR